MTRLRPRFTSGTVGELLGVGSSRRVSWRAVVDPRPSLSGPLESLVERFSRMLLAVGRRRGLRGAELDELRQDVRIRLWRALESGERMESVRASYVYRTAMSAALDMIRRRRAGTTLELADDAPADAEAVAVAPDGPAAVDAGELAARIEDAVGQLAEPRDVVVRLYLSGYAREEIADLLGWTEAKTRNLLYRGLADLRGLLSAAGIGPERVT